MIMKRLTCRVFTGALAFAFLLFIGSWTRAFTQPGAPLPGPAVVQQQADDPSDDPNEQADDRNQDVDQDLDKELNEEHQDLDADHHSVEGQVGPDLDEPDGPNNNVDDREMDQKDDMQQEIDDAPPFNVS